MYLHVHINHACERGRVVGFVRLSVVCWFVCLLAQIIRFGRFRHKGISMSATNHAFYWPHLPITMLMSCMQYTHRVCTLVTFVICPLFAFAVPLAGALPEVPDAVFQSHDS